MNDTFLLKINSLTADTAVKCAPIPAEPVADIIRRPAL